MKFDVSRGCCAHVQSGSSDTLVGTARGYSALTMKFVAAGSGRVPEQRKERSMNTFMLLTFVLVFLLGSVAGAWSPPSRFVRAEPRRLASTPTKVFQ
jgi:hypothetical protein